MKQKKSAKRRLIRFMLIVLSVIVLSVITLLLTFRYLNSQPRQLRQTQKWFVEHEATISITNEKLLAEIPDEFRYLSHTISEQDYEKLQMPDGVRDTFVYDTIGENYVVQYYLGGFGIAPSSSYYGVYYSEDSEIINLLNLGFRFNKQLEYIEEEDAWYFEELGDNSIYVKALDENWFFWRLTY